MLLTLAPNHKQHLAWQILRDLETTEFLYGGAAGGGKSWLGCEWLITNCLAYPDTRYFIARKTLKNLKKTTLRTFFKVARHHSLVAGIHFVYSEQASTITFPQTGSVIDLLEVDFKPSDPDFEDLGSAEYTQGWLEEAGEICFEAYDTLKVRIGRHLNDKYGLKPLLYITCNPSKNWLYPTFYKPWREGALPPFRKFLQALVDDNPKNEKAYKQQLLSITDKAKKQRLLYGNWEYDDDPSALIEYDAIIDLFTNTVDVSSERFISGDAARYGGDKIVFYVWEGLKIVKIFVYQKQGIDTSSEKLKEIAAEWRVPRSHIIVDEDGVGGGIVDNVRGIKGFVANSTPLPDGDNKKPNYASLKAQCSYKLAEYTNARKISIETEDAKFKEMLTEELEQIKSKDADKDGKLQIQPKEKVKELIGRSPDYSDTLMMRMFFELKYQPHVAVGTTRLDRI